MTNAMSMFLLAHGAWANARHMARGTFYVNDQHEKRPFEAAFPIELIGLTFLRPRCG